MLNCTISSNESGISGSGKITVSNSTLNKNKNGFDGRNGTFTITNRMVCGSSGDGITCVEGDLSISNCAVFGNGKNGVVLEHSESSLFMTNCTIAGNVKSGVYSNAEKSVIIRNSIIAKNHKPESTANKQASKSSAVADVFLWYDSHKILSLQNSLLGDSSPGEGKSFIYVEGNLIGNTEAPVDPGFVKIPASISMDTTGNNFNAADWDLRLLPTSPAINSGMNKYSVDANGAPFTVDLVGKPRFNRTVDMGAYESEGK